MKNEITRLTRSDGSEFVVYKWFDENRAGQDMAVFLPGYSYCSEAPGFFFLKMSLLERGYVIYSVEYRYNENTSFIEKGDESQEGYIRDDMGQVGTILAKHDPASSLLIVGKSLGTLAQVYLNENISFRKVRNLWLTPVLSIGRVYDAIGKADGNSLLLIGDRDSYFDREKFGSLLDSPLCRVMKDTDHAFMTSRRDGDIDNHKILMTLIEPWLDRTE